MTRPMSNIAAIVLLLSISINTALSAQHLDENEASMVAWSESNIDEATALLETLVNINSGTLNRQGVQEVGAVLRTELDGLGFETRWIEQPAEMNRGGHLFASHEGGGKKKVLLIGHLDTVFEPDDAFQEFGRDGNKAFGPGVEDMKSGDVIIVYVLKALKHAGVLDDLDIRVAFTGDEELTGKPISISRKDLIEAGQWADVALGFEAGIMSDGKEWVTISRRSASNWCLEVTGKQAHSSGIFGESTGVGAIFEASRILNSFYEEVRGEQYLTFNAGTIVGGTEVIADCTQAQGRAFGKTNVVPNRVVVRGGMRTISEDQLQRARDAMRAVVARNLHKTQASISFVDSYPAMAPTKGNKHLGKMLSQINQDLGRKPMPELDASRRGAADISFVAPYTDGLAGMGAYGKNSHTPNESLELDSISIAIQRAAILIYRLNK